MIEAWEPEEAIGRETQHANEYATKYYQAKIELSIRAEEWTRSADIGPAATNYHDNTGKYTHIKIAENRIKKV